MPKNIIVLSLITFVLAVLMVGFVWAAISVVARMNPGLNLGNTGYVPEENETRTTNCSGDQICMVDLESGIERIVPSTCNDTTPDVAAMESAGFVRCAAIAR